MTVGALLRDLTLGEFQNWIAWYAERDRRMAATQDLQSKKLAAVEHDWQELPSSAVAAVWGAANG